MCAGFLVKLGGASTCFAVEIRASMLERSILLDTVKCCHPVQRYAAIWVRPGTLLICRPMRTGVANSHLFTDEDDYHLDAR